VISVDAVPDPVLSLDNVDISGASLTVSNLLVDMTYAIQETDSLMSTWTNTTSITAAGGITNWLDSGSSSMSRFYRVVVP
jgi:hypothetical protein